MGDNMEDRLDEDFRFYLTFTKVFFGNLIDKNDLELCQVWLKKLCSEDIVGVAAKRCRNIYLSHLVLAMQDGKLRVPFLHPPPTGGLPPSTVFGQEQSTVIEPPKWLAEVVQGCGGDVSRTSRDGRTYLATRNLGQRGAFGCVAINMEQPEPQWLQPSGGGGESGGCQFEDPTVQDATGIGAAAGGSSPGGVPAAGPTAVVAEEPEPMRGVRLPGGGSLHDVSVRLAGGSDAMAGGELRFTSPLRRPPSAGQAEADRVNQAGAAAAAASSAGTVRRPRASRSPVRRLPSPTLDERWYYPLQTRNLGEVESEGAMGMGSSVPPLSPLSLQDASAVNKAEVVMEQRRAARSFSPTRGPAPDTEKRGEGGSNGESLWPAHVASTALQTRTAQGNGYGSDSSLQNMPPLQILDNIRHMLSMRPGPEDRQKVLEFYHGLIENVDAVWNGKAKPLPEIVSLLSKIRYDLKGMLAPLDPEQHSRTILIILRDKLVRRIKEVHERERKLDCAEKLLSITPEEASNTSLKIPSPLSDVLWNEAIHQTPKRQNLVKLQEVYDESLIDKFINLLALEKGKVIEKHKKQYEKSVQCMKQKLQEKISDAVNAYILAREDWAEVSCLLENVQNAQIEAALCKSGKSPPSKEHWKVINQLMDQIKESQGHYESEIQRGEDLRMLLVAEHQSNHLVQLIASNNMQQLENDNSELQDAIHQLELEIKNQHQRIDELKSLLQEKYPSTLNSE